MDYVICFPYCCILRQLGSLSWLKVTTHTPFSQYTSVQFVRPVSQKAVRKEQLQRHSCCWHALLCKFRHKKFTYAVCFFSRDSRSTHYNFRLRKWTYFLLPHTQGHSLTRFDPGGKFLLSLQYDILRMKISAKTHIKFTKATLAKEDKILPKRQSIFWSQKFSKDYMDINQVVKITTFRTNMYCNFYLVNKIGH